MTSPVNVQSLNTIPQEVLEYIAFFTGTESLLGPPTTIIPLLSINRRTHAALSITSNHHLYARIFAHKFDIGSAGRHLVSENITALALASELRRRCFYLKRIRARSDSVVDPLQEVHHGEEMLQEILWLAYLMMLENDGKNEQQLRGYARIDLWLKEYWFHKQGASYAQTAIKVNRWPPNNEQTSLAMWLFWFLLRPDEYTESHILFREVVITLKLLALGAHQYSIASPTLEFLPRSMTPNTSTVVHYSQPLQLSPPCLAAPAILSFFTLANIIPASPLHSTSLLPPQSFTAVTLSQELDCEWEKCLNLGRANLDSHLSKTFRAGSIEGVWEGVFTYTEFTAYAALLSGAPPPVLQQSLVAKHRQTWKLREYHLNIPDCPHPENGIDATINPLSPGDPLQAYIPSGTHFHELSNGIEVREPLKTIYYRRAPSGGIRSSSTGVTDFQLSVRDIIIIGEGHSAWGQFNLRGRVRPCDGFVSLSKEYVDGDRGKWLYRGYLVGNVHGKFTGRWRDTVSPFTVPGYEGCFVMNRRR